MPVVWSTRVSGGETLQSHIDGITGGAFLAAVVRNYREQYRQRVIPALAFQTPKVSGDLAKSYRVGGGRVDASFALRSQRPGAAYVDYVRFKDPRQTGGARSVRELAHNIHGPMTTEIAARAHMLALAEVT